MNPGTHSAGRQQAGSGGNRGGNQPHAFPGTRKRRKERPPALAHDEARKAARDRIPKVRMTAQRRDLAHRAPTQAERPILRVGQNPARLRKPLRELLLEPENLPSEIEAQGQIGGEGFGKIRAAGPIGRSLGQRRFIIQDRQRQIARRCHQRGTGPVSDGHDVGDRKVPRGFGQFFQQPRFHPGGIGMGIGRRIDG